MTLLSAFKMPSRKALSLIIPFMFVLSSGAIDALAQTPDLADYYRSIWFQERSERMLRERGMNVAPFAAEHIHATSDSLRWNLDWRDRAEELRLAAESRVRMRSLRSVKRLERPVYEDRFISIPRAYYGSETMMPIDTTRTSELRARLEAEYGAPARTVHDLYDHNRRRVEDYIQFEYWFVVNDTVPLIVMDVGGPLERGLVFATHARYRDILPDLKRMFGRHVTSLTKRDPYADHFFNQLDGRWYLTGFDGRRYVFRQIRQPDLRQGRPWVGSL